MGNFTSYDIIMAASIVVILSFFFSEISKRTNVPSVLLLIILGVAINIGLGMYGIQISETAGLLELLGIVGLIMIVLEAALELKLARDKLVPIAKAFSVAAIGLLISTWAAAEILQYFVAGMSSQVAWLYATPLSILSSAIIIPSVGGLRGDKKEFHIYESTFSDILGIIVFYFLVRPFDGNEHLEGNPLGGYLLILATTVAISLFASYLIVFVFQKITSHVKLFLLIAVLLLLYAIGKKFHLSSLIIILIFGLMFANIGLFFFGPLKKLLHVDKLDNIYEGLHVVTLETAFVVRTFFFVVFGLSIDPFSLLSADVALISGLIILSIYFIRLIILRIFIGRDVFPQLFVAPRGLITVLLFNAIPASVLVPGFEPGILLFVIIGTSLIMTGAMIQDKKRAGSAVRRAESTPVGLVTWEAPSLADAAALEELELNEKGEPAPLL